jgi:DNA-binding CsgD family transcriptional regulator
MPALRDLDFTLLDRLPVPASVHDRAGRFVYVNEAARALPALPQGFLRGEPLLSYVPESMRAHVGQRITDALVLTRPALLSVVLQDPRAPARRIALSVEVIPVCRDGLAEGFLALAYRDGDVAAVEAEVSTPVRLTSRQQEILALLVRGSSTEEIARALYIKPGSVRNHVHELLRKLDVKTRAEAVAAARRRGLVPPQPVRAADVPPL